MISSKEIIPIHQWQQDNGEVLRRDDLHLNIDDSIYSLVTLLTFLKDVIFSRIIWLTEDDTSVGKGTCKQDFDSDYNNNFANFEHWLQQQLCKPWKVDRKGFWFFAYSYSEKCE